MLEVNSLHFDYPETPLLQGVQFSVSSGSLLHLRGANGAGKTTLLKLLAGLLHPTKGDIRYQGRLISDDLAAYQRNLCYVGHKSGVSLLLTVRENCFFDLHHHQSSFEQLLVHFSLSEVADMPCGLLSAGQRRRVGLLRLLLSNSSLWLLDEPLVALDQEGVELLMASIRDHLANKGQIVLTSHQRLPLSREQYQEYFL